MRFTDLKGRVWRVNLDVAAAMDLRRVLGVDLLGNGWAAWLTEPENCVNAAYVICRAEADRLGVSDRKFGRLVRGPVLPDLAEAVVEAVLEFLPEGGEAPIPIPGEDPKERKMPSATWENLFEAAGALGVDPRGFTVRQLMWMVKGFSKSRGARI